jgi:primosomal protein N' (replication factor Y)
MSERETLFVNVILPLSVRNEFTYRVPFELNDFVRIGLRVIVPFGKGKLYTGIVVSIHTNVPKDYQVKYVEHILDETPIINQKQIHFWNWISEYYMAPIGDVYNAGLPSNFKLASETKIVLHPDFDKNNASKYTNSHIQKILETLEIREVLDLKEISEIVQIKTIQPIIKQMLEARLIISLEEVNEKFTPKTAVYYYFSDNYSNEKTLNNYLEELHKQKGKIKQFEALLAILSEIQFEKTKNTPVAKKILLDKNVSVSALDTLVKNGILISEKFQIDRLRTLDNTLIESKEMSGNQKNALKEIRENFESKDVCLLHGVTGSGKTEIYIDLIQEQLEEGKQILFLLPEIALTTQLIQRLQKHFGDAIGVYHSKFNQNERVEIWNHVLNNDPNKYRIVMGARSSIFLPFQNLGLIIVDEEHESSFKQYDPSPRYNAKDSSIVLGLLHKAKIVLGSATPSIESYYNAKSGKFGLVELSQRFGGVQLPEIFCADIKQEKREKTMHSHISSFLMQAIEKELEQSGQIILFQNRRGYTPSWNCEICNWTPKCTSCDVSLTYHKHSNTLKCHYCGYTSQPIGTCLNCGSNKLQMIGFGTEKIEDELSIVFPNKQIRRLDLDTTRSKNAYSELIHDFESRKIDILIGTQMITKGLDFDNVNLVGILDADMLLNRPDFRAFERSYQLMSQVAGRSGRKQKRGKVIIQTGQPEHWIIQKVIAHDYENFYKNEIIERRNFFYPPFYKIIQLTLKHRDANQLDQSANQLAIALRDVFKERILGPEFPIIPRINNFYLKQITIKIEREVSNKQVKERIQEIIDSFFIAPSNKSVRISIDVDPN